MPIQELPSNPSFENLRKQAKSLQKAVRSNQPQALLLVREFHPKAGPTQTFRLSDAQLVIARSYDFPSWTKLKQYVEVLAEHSFLPPHPHSVRDSEPAVDGFVRLACLDYLADHADRRIEAPKMLA